MEVVITSRTPLIIFPNREVDGQARRWVSEAVLDYCNVCGLLRVRKCFGLK